MISIDIGGTQTRVACFKNNELEIVEVFATNKQNPIDTCDKICNAIKDLDFKKVSILAPGPHDFRSTKFTTPPNLPGWHNFKIVEFFEKKYINVEVLLLNDAKGAAMGEAYINNSNDLLFFTLSTGFGCGIVVNNIAPKGVNNQSGELYNSIIKNEFAPEILGSQMTIEELASGTGMYNNAVKLGYEINSTKDIFENEKYQEFINYVAKQVATFIYNLNLAFDMETIVLGGSVILKNPKYFEAIKVILTDLECNAKIKTAEENGFSGLYAVRFQGVV